MAEIKHRDGIKASLFAVYKAIASDTGLASWWINKVLGTGKASVIAFRVAGCRPCHNDIYYDHAEQ